VPAVAGIIATIDRTAGLQEWFLVVPIRRLQRADIFRAAGIGSSQRAPTPGWSPRLEVPE